MSIDNFIKKKIQQDWLSAFPELSLYNKDKLYKLVGPLVIGLELIKMPREDDYRPYFVVYPLWGGKMGNDIKACLSGPLILKQFYNSKNLQYTIPYIHHDLYFKEMLTSVINQVPISFNCNITLNNIIKMFDDYIKTPPINAGHNSYLQALLQAEKMKTALYIGVQEAKDIRDQIIKIDWDIKSFSDWKVDITHWFQSLNETIANRDEFLKQIELNRQDKKISKLQSSELIL